MPEKPSKPVLGRIQDLTGAQFVRLTVESLAERRKVPGGTVIFWNCRCHCGTPCIVEASKLRSGHTQSCGCYQRQRATEAKTIHGGASRYGKHRLYRRWYGMWERCNYEKHASWDYYGGQGLGVCDRWRSFSAFCDDMEASYREGLTIERLDNSKGYEKSNCIWDTPKAQARHTRRNCYFSLNGVCMTITDWSIKLGGNHSLVRHRLNMGWPIEQALTVPAGVKRS